MVGSDARFPSQGGSVVKAWEPVAGVGSVLIEVRCMRRLSAAGVVAIGSLLEAIAADLVAAMAVPGDPPDLAWEEVCRVGDIEAGRSSTDEI